MIIETSIVVALITGVCSVIGQWLISAKNRREDETKQAVKDALQEQQQKEIIKRLDEHNGYAKRFEEISIAIAEIKTELKTLRG